MIQRFSFPLRLRHQSDEFVKIFNDTLGVHAPYRYASRKKQCSFN